MYKLLVSLPNFSSCLKKDFSWIYLLQDKFCRQYCEWWSCQIQETGMNVKIYLIT